MENKPVASASDLKVRTRAFALRVIKLYRALPRTVEAQVLGKQLLRCATSIGAQYHEAVHAKSKADFISKIECATQESEESCYWLDLLQESGIVPLARLGPLSKEADELVAILVAIGRNAKRRKQ